jgi:hypothetical protein
MIVNQVKMNKTVRRTVIRNRLAVMETVKHSILKITIGARKTVPRIAETEYAVQGKQ